MIESIVGGVLLLIAGLFGWHIGRPKKMTRHPVPSPEHEEAEHALRQIRYEQAQRRMRRRHQDPTREDAERALDRWEDE